MSYWYSPSTGGFYPANRKGKGKPADAVLVTAAEHAELFPADQPHREIETGPNGKPRWKVQGIDQHRAAAVALVKREAARRIEAVLPLYKQLNALRDCMVDPRQVDHHHHVFAMIDRIRAASNHIEQDLHECANPDAYPVSDNPLWPEN